MPWNEKKDKSKRLHKVDPIKEKTNFIVHKTDSTVIE